MYPNITCRLAVVVLLVSACQPAKPSSAKLLASLSDSVLAHSSALTCLLGDDPNTLQRVEQCRTMSGDTAVVIARVPGGTRVTGVSRSWSFGSEAQSAFDAVAAHLAMTYGQGVTVCFGDRPDSGLRWLRPGYHITLLRQQAGGRLELNYHDGSPRYKDECRGG